MKHSGRPTETPPANLARNQNLKKAWDRFTQILFQDSTSKGRLIRYITVAYILASLAYSLGVALGGTALLPIKYLALTDPIADALASFVPSLRALQPETIHSDLTIKQIALLRHLLAIGWPAALLYLAIIGSLFASIPRGRWHAANADLNIYARRNIVFFSVVIILFAYGFAVSDWFVPPAPGRQFFRVSVLSGISLTLGAVALKFFAIMAATKILAKRKRDGRPQ